MPHIPGHVLTQDEKRKNALRAAGFSDTLINTLPGLRITSSFTDQPAEEDVSMTLPRGLPPPGTKINAAQARSLERAGALFNPKTGQPRYPLPREFIQQKARQNISRGLSPQPGFPVVPRAAGPAVMEAARGLHFTAETAAGLGATRLVPGPEVGMEARAKELREQGVGTLEAARRAFAEQDLPSGKIPFAAPIPPGLLSALPEGERAELLAATQPGIPVGVKGATLLATDPLNLLPGVGFLPRGVFRGAHVARAGAADIPTAARAGAGGFGGQPIRGPNFREFTGTPIARNVGAFISDNPGRKFWYHGGPGFDLEEGRLLEAGFITDDLTAALGYVGRDEHLYLIDDEVVQRFRKSGDLDVADVSGEGFTDLEIIGDPVPFTKSFRNTAPTTAQTAGGPESVSAGILPDAVRDSIVRVRQAVDEGIEVFRQRGREPTGLEGVPVGRRRGLDPDDVQEEIALEGLAERFGELEIQMRQRGVTLTREIEGEVQRAQESLARIGGRAKAAGTARRENTLLLDAIAERHGGRGIADITDILADVPEGFAGGRLGTRLLEDTEDPALAAAADRDADQVIKDTRRILFGEGGADLEARQTAGGPEALAKTAPAARGAGLTPDEAAARTVMSDLPDFNQTVDIAIRPDMWRRIANLPVIRRIQGRFNPSAVANNPIEQAFVGRAVLQHAGGTLTQRTMAPLGTIGSQEQVFGKLTPEGLIADGPLKGVTVNTVRSNPGAFAGKLTPAMDEWIRVADNIERAKLDFLKKNGIEIRELTFEEGGQYAGRRLWGRVDSENNVLAVAHVGAGPARVGAKLAAEQPRIFKTAEEAIAEGFRYIPDDEALFLNVQGAYNRVADERMANWLFDRVDWRTATVPEGIKVAREAAQRRLALANRSITAIQRAIRGETLPTGTVKAIERLFPQLEGRLREPTRVRIADVLKAAKTLEQPERVLEVPKIGAIRKVQKLLEAAEARLAQNPSNPALQREVSRLRSSLGFIRYRIALGEPLTLPHNVVKALRQDAIGDLRELLDAIRGTRTIRPGQRAPRFEGGLIEEVRREVAETLKKSAVARQRAISPRFDEGIVRAPAFAGKFFDAETARIINEMLDPGFSQALASVNQVNAVSRYFSLAGDASPFLIQLLYLAGGDYKAYAKAGRGFLKALTDPKFQDSYLALPESQAMLQKYPGYVLVKGGATEFTEAAGRGGLLSVERPILPEGEAAAKTAALLAPRVVGRVAGTVIKPFARGFEGAMDVAGLEMLKALDHLGTTPERIDDLAQFVNEFRGVTSSARLGLSPIQQQLETASLLAPRYNRAIAALLFDTVHGGLRGDLARKSLARGVGAVIAVGMAISYARGEREDEMLRHLNPADPTFMTWKIGNQNIGPGTKIRSVVRLFGQSARDPRALLDTSVGWGDLEYMRNPIIKFGRGLSSPVVSGAWDLLTGKDFIGEPTRDGLLSFTETIAKRFMFLWAHTALFEGGTPIDRLSRGLAEFAGLRAWPRNRILEVSDKWKPELKKYLDIDTDGPGISRSKYRERNPEVDAKLWIVGRVTSLKSGEASVIVQQLIANNDLDPNEIKAVKKDKERKKRLTAAGISLAPRSVEQRRVDRLIKALTANNERPGQ